MFFIIEVVSTRPPLPCKDSIVLESNVFINLDFIKDLYPIFLDIYYLAAIWAQATVGALRDELIYLISINGLSFILGLNLEFITYVLGVFSTAISIYYMRGTFFQKVSLFIYRYFFLRKIRIYINVYLDKFKERFIDIFISGLSLLIKDIDKHGPHLATKNFITNIYEKNIVSNNIVINSDLTVYLYCWGFFLMLTKLGIFVFLGLIFFSLSNFLSILSITIWFSNNQEIKKFTPDLHKLGEVFLFGLLTLCIMHLFVSIYKVTNLLVTFSKYSMEIISKKIEGYLVKIFGQGSSQLGSSSSQPGSSSSQPGPGGSGGPGGPEGSGIGPLDTPKKRSYNKRRSKEEIKASVDELKKEIGQNIGESYAEYNNRIANIEKTRHYKNTHKDRVVKAHRKYNKENKDLINERNRKHVAENREIINKKRREVYENDPERRQSRLDSKYGYYSIILDQEDKDKINKNRRDKRASEKNHATDFEYIADVPNKELHGNYYTSLALIICGNKNKTFSSFMSFAKKKADANPELVWVHEAAKDLKKTFPELFNAKRPGDTRITEEFLDKLRAKDKKK